MLLSFMLLSEGRDLVLLVVLAETVSALQYWLPLLRPPFLGGGEGGGGAGMVAEGHPWSGRCLSDA